MKLWVCLMMLVLKAAAVEDMTGQMFIFPQETATAHVRLSIGNRQSFSALTVCHRSFTDLTRAHALFSLATPRNSNAVLTYYQPVNKIVQPHVRDVELFYEGLDCTPNKWHSACTTWEAQTGLTQLWFDGQPLTKKYTGPRNGPHITGPPLIILGQDQDKYGGGFDAKQSFVGMMTDVHMWDYVISSCEVQRYMDEFSFTPGNVINWAALDFQTNGNVLAETKMENC